uniref:Transposase Tc1-like domain-containing protein n=1 Tax=Anabas testudineus TaxID=64144 RepID=A0AAQ6IP39_ANATE
MHEEQEDLVNDLKAAGTTVTKKTIANTLCCEGLKSCSAYKAPLLKKAHVRVKFAKEHLNDSEENWVKVLWSDETKLGLFGIIGTHCVWRSNAAFDPKNTIPTIKHIGRNIMLHKVAMDQALRSWASPSLSQAIEHGPWMSIQA